METFDFPYHRVTDEYPESSAILRFGRGYSFASKPRGPDQLVFHLDFPAMFWFTTEGMVIDRTVSAQHNYAKLQDFYELHRLYEPFTYVHGSRGSMTVRFNKPIPAVKGIPDHVIWVSSVGRFRHQLDPFTVDLIMQPL